MSTMLPWIEFAHGMRDALTDVLDDEIGGTPEKVLQGALDNLPFPAGNQADGYRYALAVLRLFIEGELPSV